MADTILDDVTINQPVANAAALAAIPTGSLVAGDLVTVISDTNGLPSLYKWSGSVWVLFLPNIDMVTSKATPVLADEFLLADSAAGFVQKKTTGTASQTMFVTLTKVQSLLTGFSTGILGVTTGTGALATLAKLILPTGANRAVGTTSAMSGTPGTITVATTAVTASSLIFVTRNTSGGTLGQISVPVASIVAATSFVINSNANETSTFNYLIIN